MRESPHVEHVFFYHDLFYFWFDRFWCLKCLRVKRVKRYHLEPRVLMVVVLLGMGLFLTVIWLLTKWLVGIILPA